MTHPRIDDRDWSAATLGERIRQIEQLAALPVEVQPFLGDRNRRDWDYHGGNKPSNMASDAPGMNPGRWVQGE